MLLLKELSFTKINTTECKCSSSEKYILHISFNYNFKYRKALNTIQYSNNIVQTILLSGYMLALITAFIFCAFYKFSHCKKVVAYCSVKCLFVYHRKADNLSC